MIKNEKEKFAEFFFRMSQFFASKYFASDQITTKLLFSGWSVFMSFW